MDKALQSKLLYWYHIGGNVHCNTGERSVCVNIRQYWKPNEEVVPTKKGICLRHKEYNRLKELGTSTGKKLPELDSVVPCYLHSDHMNQLGALQCAEFNPNDFINW